ncbi:putative DNA-directed RNA polymerase [Helianthus debilis subsp. tardiflorus]
MVMNHECWKLFVGMKKKTQVMSFGLVWFGLWSMVMNHKCWKLFVGMLRTHTYAVNALFVSPHTIIIVGTIFFGQWWFKLHFLSSFVFDICLHFMNHDHVNNTFLLLRDILTATDGLIRIKFGMGTLDDMNHLQNKRISSVADLLQEQFGLALVRLENMARGNIYATLKHNWTRTPQNLINSTPLTDTYKVFFSFYTHYLVCYKFNNYNQL